VSATQESLDLLKRIATAAERCAIALEQMAKRSVTSEVASDRDLDSQYGNEKVRFNPRDWTGDLYKGRYMSECPSEFLDMLADGHEYFAQKNAGNDEKKAGYDRRSAARARGWAKRIREGWQPRLTQEDADPDNGAETEEIPSPKDTGGWT